MRRSAAVSASAGGAAGSVPGSGSLFEVGNEVGRAPEVSGLDLDDLAVRVDHRGAEVVNQLPAVGVPLEMDPELPFG